MASLNYSVAEGDTIYETVTFDDFGFIDDVVFDWDVTSVNFDGDATLGQDYTINSVLTETDLQITFSAESDGEFEGTETALVTIVGYIDYVAPPGTNGEAGTFYTNVNDEFVFGVLVREPIGGTVQVDILDTDIEVPNDIQDLYMTSDNLSDHSKAFIDAALDKAFEENPGADIGTIIEEAFIDLVGQRNLPGNSTDVDLRDAEYYLYGLYASSNGDIMNGALVAGAPAYNGLKGLANSFGAGDLFRSDPDKPNSPPGGSAAAIEGLIDGLSIDGDQNSGNPSVPFHAPFTESYITDDFLF